VAVGTPRYVHTRLAQVSSKSHLWGAACCSPAWLLICLTDALHLALLSLINSYAGLLLGSTCQQQA
jgi:hypothetical protein